MNGFTQIGKHLFKCDKCGKEIPSGILNIATHWNKCIDEFKTLRDMEKLYESGFRMFQKKNS